MVVYGYYVLALFLWLINPMNYIPLEPSVQTDLNLSRFSFDSTSPLSLDLSLNFIFMVGFVLCAFTAAAMATYGYGILRLGVFGSDSAQRLEKGKKIGQKALGGFLGISIAYLTILTLNPDLLRTSISLEYLKVGKKVGGSASSQSTPYTSSPSCASTESVLASLPTGLCGNTMCSALSGCNYQKYLSIIKETANSVGIDYRLIVVTMCKESKGNAGVSPNKNPDGTYDCGLMQINQPGGCSASILIPQTNIALGAKAIKSALSSVREIPPGIPQIGSVFAIYNGGPSANAQSVDCTTQAGFPNNFPKWACPINPGSGQFNMCAIKSYACDLTSCVNQVP